MLTLVVKELTGFQSAVKRDLIADGISRPKPPTDRDFLKALIDHGNNYLMTHKEPEAVIWFDINFGDPAVVGMTWAWNPHDPIDHHTGMDFFWRMWSETDPVIGSLPACQEAFAAYCVQR